MTNLELNNTTDTFDWNTQYIVNHTLDNDVIEKSGIETLPNEIFVRFPRWDFYYVSQYGKMISTKFDKIKLLKPGFGATNRDYIYYKLSNSSFEQRTVSAHRAVAEVFCPNFWGKHEKLEAHHISGDRTDNYYRNIILLTVPLHHEIHKIKEIVRLNHGRIEYYENPLDLVRDTNLTLDDVILGHKDHHRKPLKSTGGYSVFNIKDNLIGYKFYKNSKKES